MEASPSLAPRPTQLQRAKLASSASAWAADSRCCWSPATASQPPASTTADPLPKDVDDFLKTACPVVGSYGGLAKWEQGVAGHSLDSKR